MKRINEWTKQNKKHIILPISCVVAALIIIGGVTLAYLMGKDEVENRFTAKELSILMAEPQWIAVGEDMAQKMEPGMTIPKDPYVINDCDAYLYIRMKLVLHIEGNDGNRVTLDPTSATGIPTEYQEIYNEIITSIYCYTADSSEDNSGSVSDDSGSASGSGGSTGNGSGSASDSSGSTGDDSGSGIGVNLYVADGTGYTSGNPCFTLDTDGWFYYTGTNGGYRSVSPGSGTDNLFDYIQVPVLKTEYNGIFDRGFNIEVVAQAISATTPDYEVKDTFDTNYTEAVSAGD